MTGGVYRSGRVAGGEVRVVHRDGALELRVDGTFASVYRRRDAAHGIGMGRPGRALLALPPEGRRLSLLILGLGGGSAARLARALAPRARIVGVEIDPRVVALARRWFGLGELGLEVVRADAEGFLAGCRERFDAVLEDVFVGPGRAVRKPDWIVGGGLARAAACVAPGRRPREQRPRRGPGGRALPGGAPSPASCASTSRTSTTASSSAAPRRLSARTLRAAVAASPLLSPTPRQPDV